MADNQSPDEVNTNSAQEFPHKMRVHALARILGLSSREVLVHLADLGIVARSPQSSIVRSTAIAVRDKIAAGDEAAGDGVADAGVAEVPGEAPADTGQDAPPSAAPVADEQAPAPVEPVVPRDTPEPAPPALEEPGSGPVVTDATAAEAPDEVAASVEVLPTEVPSEDLPSATSTPHLFSAIEEELPRTSTAPVTPAAGGSPLFLSAEQPVDADDNADQDDADDDGDGDTASRKRRRGRRGRGRGRGDQGGTDDQSGSGESGGSDDHDIVADASTSGGETEAAESSDEAVVSDVTSDEAEQSDKPDVKSSKRKRSRPKKPRTEGEQGGDEASTSDAPAAPDTDDQSKDSSESDSDTDAESADSDEQDDSGSANRRRRRRRRRKGGDGDDSGPSDDPPNTVVHEREPRNKPRVRDEVQGISGSTRLEAKRQRRRDGRDAGRRRPPILSESEFLARREAVDRVMVVRERSGVAATVTHDAHGDDAGENESQATRDYTQVAVLEDGVLVEHFVTTSNSSSMVGNIYLGRVQNVLPGMEAAFVDIGRGRNGVLYAGEVNWDAAGLDGGSRKIEQALRPGDPVLVQVSKDPVGHKGARLTTQISLAGRYLVYVPGGGSTGISRKLPDTERKRLKGILGKIVPDDAGVIIRTASEGVAADELTRDIERLQQQWETINAANPAAGKSKAAAPQTLYEEPDLLVKVVRDLFNEDFKKLVVEGNGAWTQVENYVRSVAPDLLDRTERFDKAHADAPDVFDVHRIDEQLAKALDRKVWLPSGGTLIIEHTEAMTVVDVNTGKFTGSGGNLEETVTRNNLEAAEEIVRQMRLRDIGGMIVVDFIDMVLESNRDLVLRRLTEALGRDRTRHQVSEVTSLGLVQMTRKRLGTGLLEAFSTTCTCCNGRGIVIHANPVEISGADDSGRGGNGGGDNTKRARRNRRGGKPEQPAATETKPAAHSPAEHPMFRAMASHTTDPDAADPEAPTAEVTGEELKDFEVTDSAANLVESESTDTADDSAAPEVPTRANGSSRSRRASGRNAKTAAAGNTSVTAETPYIETQRIETQRTETPRTETLDSSPVEDSLAPVVADDSGVTTESTLAPEPDHVAEAAPAPKRRRAVRRKAAAPAATSPDAAVITDVITAEAVTTPPLTTSAPMTTSGSTTASDEPAVAVRRKPRRRAAGRPAGPPVEE
ncbi:ribonuclease E [Williamsia limnetica]|uniref:Ribonuclease E n=1 Tax=Williamsia limnetica TaxID=882452 RepID=A0A318RF16_WILLI|nr:Rne/Rng family ribonuclease [Williamsia limnetica]PYE13999.1 ribonuclease E [Williamsia limnetica]